MGINEVKKDLYRSKVMAKFSHYDGDTGKLFYNVEVSGSPYQFPLNTTQPGEELSETLRLADDLKGAKFAAEIKGSDLNRWIEKAISSDEFVKLGE